MDMLVASIDIFDVVSIKKRKDFNVTVDMRGEGSEAIPYEDNNAVKAALKFMERFSCRGVDITVSKNIPMCAGLGGSSADAAGVIRAMAKAYSVTDRAALEELAAQIGSDCPYMLYGGYARVSGRGQIIKPLESGLKLDMALLIPPEGVSAAECYRAFDNGQYPATKSSGDMEQAISDGDISRVGECLSNSLYLPAASLNSGVGRAYSYFMQCDPAGVNMSGSGSCVFALFENEQFAQYEKSRNKSGFKMIVTKTVIPRK